jgi:hypothetical protein
LENLSNQAQRKNAEEESREILDKREREREGA